MNDFSLIDKILILINIIISSPAFIICFFAGIVLLALYIIFTILNKKINKWIVILVWSVSLILLVIIYRNVVVQLFDNLFNNIFMALYFPNLTVYLSIILISNFMFIYSIINKKITNSHRIVNIINAVIIDILMFFIIDIVSRNNINVYETLTVYSNSRLLVLLEITSAIFTTWLLVNLLISAYNKLKKYDKQEKKELPEIIFD